MIKPINSKIIPIDKSIIGLCRIPYHGHSKGCVNFGKKDGCPPRILPLEKVFNFNKNIYAIYTSFPIGEFAERMRLDHPQWEEEICLREQKFSKPVDKFKDKLMERNSDWKINYFSNTELLARRSSREWYNPRRWQGSARKDHRKEVSNFSRRE